MGGKRSVSLDQSDAELEELRAQQADGIPAVLYVAATWFGVGRIQFAPGTIATATVLPIYWLLRFTSVPLQFAVIALVVLLSVFCAHRVAADQGQDDPQIVVIDEVAGGLIALLLVGSSSVVLQLAVLALFRVLDIFKPWPISLNLGRHAGFNIVYDDVIAGTCSGLIVWLLVQLVL
jgi:phosphatidylglycerophosphatase A